MAVNAESVVSTALLLLCVLPALPGPGAPQGRAAMAAGVAAEGPPVLSPLIGPAQEREALLHQQQREHQQRLHQQRLHQPAPSAPHHLRHQHHYGDPRLTGRHPAPGHSADSASAPAPPPAPLHAGSHGSCGSCQLNDEQLGQLASALAKNLDGACNEKELSDRFHNLGSLLADQFNVLKTMILNLEDKVGAMDIGMERAEKRLLTAVGKARCSRAGTGDDIAGDGVDAEDDVGAAASLQDEDAEGGEDADYSDLANPAFVTTNRDGAQGPSAREEEAQRYNNTVHVEYAPQAHPDSPDANLGNSMAGCGHGQRVFTYYWRVRNMDYKMTGWNHRRSLRSPSFYVWPGGYRMYLRMYPRQSGENVYVHVGLTRGEHDAALPWPFRLKHRLAVLDQVSSLTATGPGSGPVDLVSRLWDPSQLCSGYNWQRPSVHSPDNYECVGLGFPQSVLRTRSYIRQDAALVKLTLCLTQP